MIGFQTIRQGEKAAVWDRSGSVRLIDGPQRLFLLGQDVNMLRRFSAGTDEYLVVTYLDGHSEHLRGPAYAWFNPVEHKEIQVEKALSIDANEAVVVYRQEDDRVSRRVVTGPDLFVPTADEWLHEFAWHGADPHNPRQKIPNALRFTKLRIIPDQMYFDVFEVRTADDALLVIKLMVFFELMDIERMLDQTHDPIADFINALSADVIDFLSGLTLEQFKDETDQLNDLATYSQLVQRSERIGYRINKVVYRGYHASNALQSMHDHAIEARTKLRLEAETENQAQELADLRLQKEVERSAKRQDMEEAEVRHRNQLEALAHQERLRQQQAEREQEAEVRRMVNEIELKHQQDVNREQLAFLNGMTAMNVDLTRYLVAQYQNPDRLIRIEEGRGTQLHLHD